MNEIPRKKKILERRYANEGVMLAVTVGPARRSRVTVSNLKVCDPKRGKATHTRLVAV